MCCVFSSVKNKFGKQFTEKKDADGVGVSPRFGLGIFAVRVFISFFVI
jgi:hypothetical protein